MLESEYIGLYLLGESFGEFGASLAMKVQDKKAAGSIKGVDYKAEFALWDLLLNANEKGLLECANSVGVGGVALSVAKMVALSCAGVDLKSEFKNEAWLFEESASRAVVGVKDEEAFLNLTKKFGIKAFKLGLSTKKQEFIFDSLSLSCEELKKLYFESFKEQIL